VMPTDDGLVILWGTAGNVSFLFGSLVGVKLTLCFLIRLDADVDVAELKFHVGNEIDPSDLGDDSKRFRVIPSVDQEWRVSDLSADDMCLRSSHDILGRISPQVAST
jgi:hypothetical protein